MSRAKPNLPVQQRAQNRKTLQTVQRQEILTVLQKAKGPLTAAHIYELARQQVPELGLSTVYRALKLLQDTQLVQPVTLPDGVARYEMVGRGPHHFHCRICGQIWTLQSGEVSSLSGSRVRGNFLVENHESTLHGRCPNCNRPSSNSH